jgi:hypothetical protein
LDKPVDVTGRDNDVEYLVLLTTGLSGEPQWASWCASRGEEFLEEVNTPMIAGGNEGEESKLYCGAG